MPTQRHRRRAWLTQRKWQKGGTLPPRPPIRCQCSPNCTRPVKAGNMFCAYHMSHGCPIKSPTTGVEPDWKPEDYNSDPAKKHSHNCYAFALQVHDQAKIDACREKQNCDFHAPGINAEHPEFSGKLGKTCPDVMKRTLGDSSQMYMTDFTSRCKPGFRKIAAIVDKHRDFHYLAQFKEIYVPELKRSIKGLWGHKPGARDATMRDGSGAPIWRPDLAHWYYPPEGKGDDGLYYDSFCSYMCVNTKKTPHLKGGTRRQRRKRQL